MGGFSPLRWLKTVRHEGWAAVQIAPRAVSHVVVVPRAGQPWRVLEAATAASQGNESDALLRLKRSAHLDRRQVTVVLALGEYQIIQIDPPQVPEAELRQAVRWQVKGMLDFPVDEATVDILPIPDQDGRRSPLFVVCAPNKVIEKHVRLHQEAKVPLVAIDIPETVQRNIAACFEPEGRGVAMVGFYENGGLLTFTAGGSLYSYRRIDVSLPQLAEAGEVQRQSLFERVLLEVQRSLDTFEHQFHTVNVAKLMVSPLPAEIDLRDYLSANFYLPVETADLAQVLDISAVPSLRDPAAQAPLLPLLGAALRDEGAA